MRKFFYFIARIFFSKKKLLLIQLLNIIQDNTNFVKGEMRATGMCIYVWRLWQDNKISREDRDLLDSIIKENKPALMYNQIYYFKLNLYKPRFEFLKELIKKY
jgi:hypothetical protein